MTVQRPLRALPRRAAIAILLATLLALGWSVQAMAPARPVPTAEQATATDDFGDVALYAAINARVRAGESYHAAALTEHRAHDYPTRPFVTVRTPIMAWGDLLWGARGWQALAVLLLGANILAWMGGLSTLRPAERIAAVLLVCASGAGVFYDRVGLVHELVSGLCLSLALGLYRPHRWWPALLAAAAGLAIRELALPFVMLWLAFAVAEKRRREAAGVAGVILLFAAGMTAHYLAVEALRLPTDRASPGWNGLLGPLLPLSAVVRLSPLLLLPPVIAGPLAVLPLLGWAGLGGRAGAFATLWFAGFGLFVALFARAGNFYWVLLLLPAYLAGLALVPRSFADLVRAIRALPATDPGPSPVGR